MFRYPSRQKFIFLFLLLFDVFLKTDPFLLPLLELALFNSFFLLLLFSSFSIRAYHVLVAFILFPILINSVFLSLTPISYLMQLISLSRLFFHFLNLYLSYYIYISVRTSPCSSLAQNIRTNEVCLLILNTSRMSGDVLN